MIPMTQGRKYQTLAVNTLTPGELIILLYDELKLRLNKAQLALSKNHTEDANIHIQKAEDIVLYLIETLDLSYAISKDLMDLYRFIYQHLVEANGAKNPKMIEEVQKIVGGLADAWKQAEAVSHQKTGIGGKAI
jgi:flagellar protein FliS